ncbi:uncharacterized protein LOC113341090 isoform X1 [Papaver somniferum]|uniref:uncharacterized protein LOC113341090 isoform X1 n=1 Tax=Papaver somniferum TaxID=3469 RepID=UPI000E6FD84B|nr:uncharacterized protein LOC113341090 isoform X1 [Papaver somniferum]
MTRHFMSLLLSLGVLLTLILHVQASQLEFRKVNEEISAVVLSPKFVLGPGSVNFKYYFNVDFPRGHIAIKGFSAEVVDESGNSVPLYETYLHHWVAVRYYALKDAEIPEENDSGQLPLIIVKNSGVCNNIGQYFGPPSESRKNTLHVPDPYGIEVGNPAEIPDGYEERWLLNVHAIDTRGVEDRLGCTECRCNLFNVTKDEYGRPLPPGYAGGLQCCYDETTCRLREGFTSNKRGFYLRYTVKWVNWEESIFPVRIYIFDITYTAIKGNNSEAVCKVEYEIEACNSTGVDRNVICVENKKTSVVLPKGGYLICGVAHQHFGGIGSALYGDVRKLKVLNSSFIAKCRPIICRGEISHKAKLQPRPG